MGVAYSEDLRDRVLAAVDGGLGVYAAAPLFRVSVSYIYKALGRRRASGDVTAHKSGGGPKPKLAGLMTRRCAPRWRRKPTSRSSSCKPGSQTIARSR